MKSLLPALLWCSLHGARGGVHRVQDVGVEAWDLWPLVSPVLGNITEQCFTASLEYITLLNRTRAVNEPSRSFIVTGGTWTFSLLKVPTSVY